VPAFAVPRDRLVAFLDVAAQRRATVVVAPPGYGKTVLLSQWAAVHRTRRVRWLTLRPEDNEPARLARDLCGALETGRRPLAGPVLGRLHPGGPKMGSAFATALVAALESVPPTTLVLDDFHVLSNSALLDELGALIEHVPRWIHVIVATRTDPPLPYYRLRLSDALVELRQQDLAFRHDEATELVQRLSGRKLSAAQIGALIDRTEGWAVGLHLTGVSLRGHTDVERFVRTFADDDRHIADYLTDQVLRRQPQATRRFLLSTCVLDRMSGPLCDFVTGGRDGQAMLEELHRTSLFVTRLEGRHEWFRYHQLLRTLLRHHLHDEDPTRERLVLRRAAEWHLARDDLEEGVGYLAEAAAWEDVFAAAFTHSGALFARGEAMTVARWIDMVPRTVWRGRTRVMLLRAGASVMGGDPAGAGDDLDAIDALPTSAAERVVATVLRSRWALQQGATTPAVAAADRALRAVETVGDTPLPNVLGLLGSRQDVSAAARVTRGTALLHQGETTSARTALEDVTDRSHVVWQIRALGSMALLEAWCGRLTLGDELAARALSLARQVGIHDQPITTDAYLALAHVARQRDELDRAASCLDQAAREASPSHDRVAATVVTVERALLALTTRGPADGLAVLAARRSVAHPPHPRAVHARQRAVEARLRAMIGDVEGAERALGTGAEDNTDVVAARVRLAIERGDLAAARALASRWPDDPEPRARLERRMWLAILDDLDGDETAARHQLADVVADAETERNIGLFRSAGHHVLGPARALYRAAPTAFLRTIVEPPDVVAAPQLGPARELVDQLTEREFMVLTMLPTRASNAEIADRLGVSVNTVKTHLKHIYRKLAVDGRNDAVAAAERMRLL